jgi:3'-phosphoadenosine 5'-phosphosulfate (PAPS) 3'-phosphatase
MYNPNIDPIATARHGKVSSIVPKYNERQQQHQQHDKQQQKSAKTSIESKNNTHSQTKWTFEEFPPNLIDKAYFL